VHGVFLSLLWQAAMSNIKAEFGRLAIGEGVPEGLNRTMEGLEVG